MRREFSATLRFIHVSQNEKFAAHLGAFLSGNSIRFTCAIQIIRMDGMPFLDENAPRCAANFSFWLT